MKKYQGFSIAFATKGYLRNNNIKEHRIKGKAFYLYDPNDNYKIYKQFIQIEIANFRPTDIDMLKTSYYTKRNNINIRFNILEKIQEEFGYDKNKITKEQKIRINIPEQYIEVINQELLKLNRVKASIDVFTGSNSSGAETVTKNTDIISISDNHKLNGINFTNPLNTKEVYKNKEVNINSIDQIELIEFEKYLELNPIASQKIDNYNIIKLKYIDPIEVMNQQLEIYSNDKEKIEEIHKELDNHIRFNKLDTESVESFLSKVDEKILVFLNKNQPFDISTKEYKSFVNALRSYQKIAINIEVKQLYENHKIHYYDFIENQLFDIYEHCHIIPVSQSKLNPDTLIEISDPNNCLLLSPNIHAKFDYKEIYFDENGNCYFKNNKLLLDNIKINQFFLNKKRKEYLKRYIKEFIYLN